MRVLPFVTTVTLVTALASFAQGSHRAPLPDPIRLSLWGIIRLSDAVDSIGLYSDALALREMSYDGSIDTAVYCVARIDEVMRHVHETAWQHGAFERVRPIVQALDDAAETTRVAVMNRVALISPGAMQRVSLAGVLDPASASFPDAFTERARPLRWIAIRHSRRVSRDRVHAM